jgi:hypothetical protein
VEIVDFEPELIFNANDIIIQAKETKRRHGGAKLISPLVVV